MKPDVVGELFAKYYNDALLYVLSLCKNKVIAEDVTSNAFFKALTDADDDIRRFKPWLLTVCRNEYLSLWRKQNRIKYTELKEDITDESQHLLDRIIRNEEYRALYRAISLLADEQREVIVLFYYARVSVKEIAEVIGKSEANTKVLLHRARKALKDILEVER